MENKYNLKPFDKVLVRDKKENAWRIDLFERYLPEDCYNFNYACLRAAWEECIPYKGNEHLLGTTKTPEITDLENNILFGIELQVGYVLEFEDSHKSGVIIPTNEGLAVVYTKGCWDYLENISVGNITAVRGFIEDHNFIGGKILWHK